MSRVMTSSTVIAAAPGFLAHFISTGYGSGKIVGWWKEPVVGWVVDSDQVVTPIGVTSVLESDDYNFRFLCVETPDGNFHCDEYRFFDIREWQKHVEESLKVEAARKSKAEAERKRAEEGGIA